jgi:hypothetical protein
MGMKTFSAFLMTFSCREMNVGSKKLSGTLTDGHQIRIAINDQTMEKVKTVIFEDVLFTFSVHLSCQCLRGQKCVGRRTFKNGQKMNQKSFLFVYPGK